jgi:hypothetical protein
MEFPESGGFPLGITLLLDGGDLFVELGKVRADNSKPETRNFERPYPGRTIAVTAGCCAKVRYATSRTCSSVTAAISWRIFW